MPQMAPINWLFMFMLFILTYLMFNILNYYMINIKIMSSKKLMIKQNKLNWKW